MEKSILEVFNVDVNSINLQEDTKKESVYYKPRQEGKEPYTALIRFLPIPTWDENGSVTGFEKEPYYHKKRYWLKDASGNGNYYDSAATINERCPIQATFFKLYNSDDIKEKKLAKDFSILNHYWGLVYIVDDKQNPDLIGKTLIWRFTSDIQKLIEKELNPVVSEYQKTPKDKIAVWDVEKGKNLALVVGQKKVTFEDGKEATFPDYEASEFLESTPLEINGKEVDQTAEGVKLISEMLDSIPKDIVNYKYSPWSDETRKEVERILARYNGVSNETVETEVTDEAQITENTTDDGAEMSSEDEADQILQNLNL